MNTQQNFVSRIWKKIFPSKSTKEDFRISENYTKQYIDRSWENKAKNTYREVLVGALKSFAKAHRASPDKINPIVEAILQKNKTSLVAWLERSRVVIPITNSANISRKNTNFYLRRIVINNKSVQIDYAVFVRNKGEIQYTEIFNR